MTQDAVIIDKFASEFQRPGADPAKDFSLRASGWAGAEVAVTIDAGPSSSALRIPVTEVRRTISVATFEELFLARGDARDALFDRLVSTVDPEELFCVAIDQFHRRGNQDRLELAARLLGEMGAAALPALDRIASDDFVGQDAFVDLIARLETIDGETRERLLSRLARSPNVATLERLSEIAESLPVTIRNVITNR